MIVNNKHTAVLHSNEIFKELNNYGKWIAGSNFLQFVYSQGDDLLVGRMLGTTSLGLYQLAYRISNLPAWIA